MAKKPDSNQKFKPGEHPNSKANLNLYSSTNQPKKNGRRPSKLKAFIEESELSAKDVALAIKKIIDMDLEELKELLEDKKQPMLIRLFVKAFLGDFKDGHLKNITSLLDRAIGTANQNVSIDANVSTVAAELSTEERREMIKDYMSKLGYDKK